MDNLTSLEEIQQIIDSNQMVFLYFGGKACGVCTALKPKIEEMLKAYPEIRSIYIDIEQSHNIAVHYNFFTIPAILLFVEGKVTMREARYLSIQEMNKGISRYYSMKY